MEKSILRAILFSKKRSEQVMAFEPSSRSSGSFIANHKLFFKKLRYFYNLKLSKYSPFFEAIDPELLKKIEAAYLAFFEKTSSLAFFDFKSKFNKTPTAAIIEVFYDSIGSLDSFSEFEKDSLIDFFIDILVFGIDLYEKVYKIHQNINIEFATTIILENYEPIYVGPVLTGYAISESGKLSEDPLKYIKIEQLNREFIRFCKEIAFIEELTYRSPLEFDPDFIVKEFFSAEFVEIYLRKDSDAVKRLALSRILSLYKLSTML